MIRSSGTDINGMDEFQKVQINGIEPYSVIPGAFVETDALQEARIELQGVSSWLWQPSTRYGMRLLILQEYYPSDADNTIKRPLVRVYEDLLSIVAHVRGPCTFGLQPNARLMKYMMDNPSVTADLTVRVRFGEVSTQAQTAQRMMLPVTNIANGGSAQIIPWILDPREGTNAFSEVAYIGNGLAGAASRIYLRTLTSYYGGWPFSDLAVANWGQEQTCQRRPLPPILPLNVGGTPPLFDLQNSTGQTISGELWFY